MRFCGNFVRPIVPGRSESGGGSGSLMRNDWPVMMRSVLVLYFAFCTVRQPVRRQLGLRWQVPGFQSSLALSKPRSGQLASDQQEDVWEMLALELVLHEGIALVVCITRFRSSSTSSPPWVCWAQLHWDPAAGFVQCTQWFRCARWRSHAGAPPSGAAGAAFPQPKMMTMMTVACGCR